MVQLVTLMYEKLIKISFVHFHQRPTLWSTCLDNIFDNVMEKDCITFTKYYLELGFSLYGRRFFDPYFSSKFSIKSFSLSVNKSSSIGYVLYQSLLVIIWFLGCLKSVPFQRANESKLNMQIRRLSEYPKNESLTPPTTINSIPNSPHVLSLKDKILRYGNSLRKTKKNSFSDPYINKVIQL